MGDRRTDLQAARPGLIGGGHWPSEVASVSVSISQLSRVVVPPSLAAQCESRAERKEPDEWKLTSVGLGL